MAPMYYKTAAAAIICYDVSNPYSFEAVKDWIDELQPIIAANNIVLAIAATKNDLADEPTTSGLVSPQKAQELAA
eukprot:CAMPEP_0204633468 /NCGR_PEP_ID=MMETSP0717-20131115/27279_1 /ASSEMBLY_ACC=CAM_ASM_000666 /TAXON_ID=230516 /ORGANISM="Chaetoceros curvisetus" /LENGTH=74 /DNA_ID=CAMNT_0051651641 /DNA_START=132 /DNA_END=352 /DNA_ORIENTATION=-